MTDSLNTTCCSMDALGRCPRCGKRIESTSGTCYVCSQFTYQWPPEAPKKPHTCPVCNGAGKVSRPPWLAGDVRVWSSGSAGDTYDCTACQGQGVLWGPS